jgi:hypothetical protein
LRELGSGKVGYNKYELVNVVVRKADEAYLAGYISKAENIRGDQSRTGILLPVNI